MNSTKDMIIKRDKIQEYINSNISKVEIAKILNISRWTVGRCASKHGIVYPPHKCLVCGTEFTTSKSKQIYCGSKCKTHIEVLRCHNMRWGYLQKLGKTTCQCQKYGLSKCKAVNNDGSLIVLTYENMKKWSFHHFLPGGKTEDGIGFSERQMLDVNRPSLELELSKVDLVYRACHTSLHNYIRHGTLQMEKDA